MLAHISLKFEIFFTLILWIKVNKVPKDWAYTKIYINTTWDEGGISDWIVGINAINAIIKPIIDAIRSLNV